jgi:hypothetical protein
LLSDNNRNAVLSHASLAHTDFTRANISNATLKFVKCIKCDFTDADLSYCVFEGADFQQCDFTGVCLTLLSLLPCLPLFDPFLFFFFLLSLTCKCRPIYREQTFRHPICPTRHLEMPCLVRKPFLETQLPKMWITRGPM